MYWLKLFGILFSLYLLANIAYAVKSLAGVKLTNQPHHGWLFPIGDEIVKLCGGYPKRR